MTIPRLRSIDGRWYWRPSKALRALGYQNVPLGSDLPTAMKRAEALNRRVDREKGAARPETVRGSVADVVRIYGGDARFAGLAEDTKRAYRSVLREIERKVGDLDITVLDRPHFRAAYRDIAMRGKAIARLHMVVWRVLLDVAMDEGLRKDNPLLGMKMHKGVARERRWSDAELAAFSAAAEAAGRPSIALAVRLAYDLGQRQRDVLRFTWHQYRGGAFVLQQTKRGAKVGVPVAPETAAALDAMARKGVHVVISEASGQPYKGQAFRDAFATIRAKAGLPADLQYRDLRRTALSEIGDAGGTDDEIRSVSGHRSRNVVSTYVVPTTTMARNAQAKRERARNRSGSSATVNEE
jgi:hypothetical protein